MTFQQGNKPESNSSRARAHPRPRHLPRHLPRGSCIATSSTGIHICVRDDLQSPDSSRPYNLLANTHSGHSAASTSSHGAPAGRRGAAARQARRRRDASSAAEAQQVPLLLRRARLHDLRAHGLQYVLPLY